MKNLILAYFSKRFIPRWLILLFDLSVVSVTFVIAFLLRFNLDTERTFQFLDIHQFLFVIPLFTGVYYIVKPYAGIIRHTTLQDVSYIFQSQTYGFVVLAVITWLGRTYNLPLLVIPLSVLAIYFTLSTFMLIASRIIIKGLYYQINSDKKNKVNIMIFGAGELGQITRMTLEKSNDINYHLVGFIDDNRTLVHKRNAGIPIFPEKEAFKSVIPKFKVTEIIIAINNDKISHSRKRAFIEKCIAHKLVVKEIPPVENWINGEFKAGQIRRLRIEDLLGRESIRLDFRKIQNEFRNAVILVTGAAGSIGSEVVRQLIRFNPAKIILLDQAESPLFNLQQELIRKKERQNYEIVIGDITNKYRMRQVFKKYKPDIVFNAAAYKHVPLMEDNLYEAVRVNLGGTKNLADLSIEFDVDKFVMISTDKAVNPTNIMGASKRLCEMYIQALAQHETHGTAFITTRFGNVLGSNGSVVPVFKRQIKQGGPVTVTHKDITRYFMTIPEACQLVLEASAISHGSEIFIFDMGQPVKIYDLAEKMISLSGLEPHKDIAIEITGLRPGEKLYEELLLSKEKTKPTHHEKIMISEPVKLNFQGITTGIEDLLNALDKEPDKQLVNRMKKMVPEFTPQNPEFIDTDEAFLKRDTPKSVYTPR